jgi:hypothetical protein
MEHDGTMRPKKHEMDLLLDFRIIDKLRDWLPIRREQCAMRALRKSRWWRNTAYVREADREPASGVAKRHGISE